MLHIKDLKDLRFFALHRSIDMQVLKDLKRCFSRVRSRGTGPRATGPERGSPCYALFGSRCSQTTVSSRSVSSRSVRTLMSIEYVDSQVLKVL